MLVNCACSLDGKLAAPDGSPILLSGEADLRRVHAMRAACDSILVGVGTVLADDPSLVVKPQYAAGANPLRVVLDTRGRTPPEARVLDGRAPTLLVQGPDAPPRPEVPGVEVATVPVRGGGLDLAALLELLGARGIRSLMVEGGGRVIRAWLEAGLVDEWTLYVAPVLVGGEGPSLWPGAPSAAAPHALHLVAADKLGEGALLKLVPR